MILRNKAIKVLLILPLMSLDSGGNYVVQKMKLENIKLASEIKAIETKIQVIDRQIRYKDSIDAISTKNNIPCQIKTFGSK